MKLGVRISNLYELGSGTSRSTAMEGVRGFAVLLIFFVHCFGLILSRRLNANIEELSIVTLDGWNAFFMWLFMSHHGVYLFFILSGFLICRILMKPSFGYLHFLWKRILRIYPAFLFSLIAFILAGPYLMYEATFEIDTFIKNLFFLNGLSILKIPAYNRVTWSLFNEFAFYLVFPLAVILVGPRLFQEKWRIVALGIALVYGPIVFGYVDARFSFFFAGAFIALFREEELREFCEKVPAHFVLGCYIFATAAWVYRILDYGTYLIFFLFGGSLLFIKASYGDGILHGIFSTKPLRYLGNISYSFYLIHALVIDLVFIAIQKHFDVIFDPSNMIGFILLTFSASWVAATFMFLVFERPYFSGREVRTREQRIGA